MQKYKKMATYDASIQKNDEKYMRRAIQLALNGLSGAAPNPMVGAVVVHDGKIIGEGYHRKCGGPHAEVNAIRSVRQPELLCESTIYVSLEPCAHYGKTPPCADLIIEKRIPRVVIGCRDPFAKVDGLGIKKLQDAGCEVVVGVLEAECLALNRRFVTFHTARRPFITLKWAQSADGFMGGECRVQGVECRAEGECRAQSVECRAEVECRAVVFSTPLTQTLVHRLRAHCDAILVGGGTALSDDPSLTVRQWAGRNPLRVVIDTHGNLPADLRLFNDEAETLVWNDWNLDALMETLHRRGVQTLLVEGGAHVLERFLEAGLWDEIRRETAPLRLGKDVQAPMLPPCTLVSAVRYGQNEIRLFTR